MFNKKIILIIMFIIALSSIATAQLSCEIVSKDKYPGDCDSNGILLLKLSDFTNGQGAHVDVDLTSSFPYHLCCYGLPGLATTTTATDNQYFVSLLGPTDNAHASASADALTTDTDYYLTAPTSFSCAYALETCNGFDTCLFSIAADQDTHLSNCSSPPDAYSKRYCCSLGEQSCTVTGIGWGMVEGEDVNIVDKAGMNQLVLMIITATGCDNYLMDFTITKTKGSGAIAVQNDTIDNILFGKVPEIFGGEDIPGYGLAVWYTTDGNGPGGDGNYTFKVTLHKDTASVESPESDELNVDSNCIAEDPFSYVVDECYASVIEAMKEYCCPSGATGDPPTCVDPCDGTTRCIDQDCDGVDDCIDQVLQTASIVDQCTGVASGEAGCSANMDCTNLEWSDCYKCEDGMPCADYGFQSEWVQERCQGLTENECKCNWIGSSEGCSDNLLNQWDKRFKGCVKEEEFPIFDNFNFIAVLILLTGYYAIILIRKKKDL